MATSTKSKIKFFTGIDSNSFNVGKPVDSTQYIDIANGINYIHQRRRCLVGNYFNRPGSEEFINPTLQPFTAIKFLAGPNTKHVFISVITAGATGSLHISSSVKLFANHSIDTGSIVSTTDLATDTIMSNSLSSISTFNRNILTQKFITVPVTASANNFIQLVNSGTYDSTMRILSAQIYEMPSDIYDSAYDISGVLPTTVQPGNPITKDLYETLALGVNELRKSHKKQLFTISTDISLSSSQGRKDIFTKGGSTNQLKWPINMSTYLSSYRYVNPSASLGLYWNGRLASPGVTGSVYFNFSDGSSHRVSALSSSSALDMYVTHVSVSSNVSWVQFDAEIDGSAELLLNDIFIQEEPDSIEPESEYVVFHPTLYESALTSSLPDWLLFSRAAGNYSYQFSAAVSGAVFMATGSSANVPRFNYIDDTGTSGLLLEPARTNYQLNTAFVDDNDDNVPDGWTGDAGAGTKWWTIKTDNPFGGAYVYYVDTGGAYNTMDLTASGNPYYIASMHYSRSHARSGYDDIPASVYAWYTGDSVDPYRQFKFPYATTYPWPFPDHHPWERARSSAWAQYYEPSDCPAYLLSLNGLGGDETKNGEVGLCMTQIEQGFYDTSWIPSYATSCTRPVETCAINTGVLPITSGSISFDWTPGYPSTEYNINTEFMHSLFAWADALGGGAGSRIEYYAGDSKIYLMNNTSLILSSSALTFGHSNKIIPIQVDFGPWGSNLIVSGATYSIADAWVPPTAGYGFINTDANGGQVAAASYKNLKILNYDGYYI